MAQEALGMVETRGLTARFRSCNCYGSWRRRRCKSSSRERKRSSIQTWRARSYTRDPETSYRCRKNSSEALIQALRGTEIN